MVDTQLVGDLLGLEGTDTVNVGQRDDHALVGGDVTPAIRATEFSMLHRSGPNLPAFADCDRAGRTPISTLKTTHPKPDRHLTAKKPERSKQCHATPGLTGFAM
jgi:hypothetical protein